jgi:hypothetical protein
MELTKEQIESLAGFVSEIFDEWPELDSLDGFDLQELGQKHKILIPRTVFAPCGENCSCAELFTDEEMLKGVTCYHIAAWLNRPASAGDARPLARSAV